MCGKGFYWLIGAKIVCCGALLLVITGVLSIGAIAAFVTGNALTLAGAALVVTVVLPTTHQLGGRENQGPCAPS